MLELADKDFKEVIEMFQRTTMDTFEANKKQKVPENK